MGEIIYTKDILERCVVRKGCDHGPAPIPEEGLWVRSKEIKYISAFSSEFYF